MLDIKFFNTKHVLGMRFTARHPEGLYYDKKIGIIYKENYKITAVKLNDCFGDIEITRLRDGAKSIVELNWFNTELTGREIELY